MPNPIDDEPLYNVVVLGTMPSPGVVTLSGHESKVEWDIKTGPALVGATTTLKAIPPVEFSASFYLVKDPAEGLDDFALWPPFQKLIDSTVGANPLPGIAGAKSIKAIAIYHPDLASNGIKSVVKASVGGFAYDGKGGGTIVVKFQSYRAPKLAPASVLGSQKDPSDPNRDLKEQVARLTQQYQATPWG